MKYELSNHRGFSLANITKPKSPTVTAYISSDIHESKNAESSALQLLYTDALLAGAGKYNREQFLDALSMLGASLNVTVGDGILTITIKCRAEVFAAVLKLVELMFKKPHFNQNELKRIKQTIINNIVQSRENSKAVAHEQLRNTIYGAEDRRYTVSDESLIKCIKATTPKQLASFNTRVLKSYITASIVGDTAQITNFKKSLTTITLNKNQSKPDNLSIHQQKPPQPTVVLTDIPSRSNIDFSIGAPLPITIHHPDYLPLCFGLAVLGKVGGFSGRLMSTVREQEGLTYGIYADVASFLNLEQGYWRIVTFFSPDKATIGLSSTFREVAKIHKEGISKAELAQFKQILKTTQVLKNDSVSSLIGELHSYHLQSFSIKEMQEHKKRLLELTLAEVNNALKTYLDPKNLTIAGAGPISNHQKELQKFIKSV